MHSIDTHQVVKSFISSGFTETQAEVILKVIVENHDNKMESLVTKTEFKDGINEVKVDIAESNNKLATAIAEVKVEMLKWYIGTLITVVTLMITFIKFLN